MNLSHEDRIRWLARRGDDALFDLIPMSEPLKDVEAEHNHKRALMLLSTACIGNSQTTLFLVQGQCLWDAEIIMRSVFEGTVKFCYLLENPATLKERCVEYSEILPTISKLRWHEKAAEALEALGDDGAMWKQPYRDMLLPEKELKDIREKYPREVRQSVEHRWGYTELVSAISKPGGAFGPVGRSALHGYMLSSHLAHMSYEGVDMPLERGTRSVERREAMELAHASRLIRDCYDLTYFRAGSIRRFLGRAADDLLGIRKHHAGLLLELEEANAKWSEVEYGAR